MFENSESSSLPPKGQIQIEHLFHTVVSYHVCKKDINVFTRPFHDLKTLLFGDKIFVQKYQNQNAALSSSDKVVMEEKNRIQFYGIVSSTSHDSSLINCHDFAYISSFHGYITDRMEMKLRKILEDILKGIPKKSQKLGTRLRCKYIKFPTGTYMNENSSIFIFPTVIQFCEPSFCNTTSPKEMDILISISNVEKLESIADLSQDLIAVYACFLCSFVKDKDQTISKTDLEWQIYNSEYAQVKYEGCDYYMTKEIKNYKNSLFSRNSVAVLKMHQSDDIPENGEEEKPKEIFVKINISKFEGKFKVRIENILQEWHLNSVNDLINAKYSLEPTDILAHWRPFIDKNVECENYIETTLANSKPSRAKILDAFMPVRDTNDMEILLQLIDPEEEFRRDKTLQFREIPYAHRIAREEISKGKPVVVIDGAHSTGKSELNVTILTVILEKILQSEKANSGSSKCLGFVSPCYTLKTQLNILRKYNFNLFGKLRILNLINFNDSESGSFLNVIEHVIRQCYPQRADKKKLIAAKELLKSKICAHQLENEHGYQRYGVYPNLSKEEKDAQKDFAETYVDLVTSQELKIYQDAIKVVFAYYRPNFVIASNEIFISLLPSMANYISHILIDEAGRMPFIEALNIVVETPNLEQLIFNGDFKEYPYHHRMRLEQRPECYVNIIKMINLNSPELSYIQLIKVFIMNPAIIKVMNDNFYAGRNLIPIFTSSLLNFGFLRNPQLPIAFHDIDGGDEYVAPTTRRNEHENNVGMKIIEKLLESRYPDFRRKILVLCNYSAEKKLMQEKKEKGNYQYVFEPQRIQTAISRARKALFIVGCRELLEECSV
uniref:DNA2/NAM7 helicase-like C-terminal domain-containing protein n=1 Tax=Panagrolaimus sp. ES5 TaxID=591445 RepID=A0AC34F570_9BILA